MTSRLGSLLGEWADPHQLAGSLADRVKMLVLDGRLTIGEHLPSERALARELGRSRATVSRAYEILQSAGYVERVQGSGTTVAIPVTRAVPSLVPGDDVIDFTIASMGSRPGFHELTVRALDRLAPELAGPGYTGAGLPDLRAAIAARYTARGLPTTSEQVLVTSGAMSALTLVLDVTARRGSIDLIEQPTFPHAAEALARAGLRLHTTPVTSDGWDSAHARDQLKALSPSVAYLIADFHNPTGALMPDLERARIAAAAHAAGTTLIIDETCMELCLDDDPVPLPFAAHGPAILIGSLSKLVWGGMRIGWIRAERDMIARIEYARLARELGTAVLEQCIAIEAFAEGERMRALAHARLRAGRDAIVEGVARSLPHLTVPDTRGGLAVWVDLGQPVSTRLSLAARDHGLLLPPGPRFGLAGQFERFARLPITWEPEVALTALERLGRAWHALLDARDVPAMDASRVV